jgi:hypothetical protein
MVVFLINALFITLSFASGTMEFQGIRPEDKEALLESIPNLKKDPKLIDIDDAVRWLSQRDIYN